MNEPRRVIRRSEIDRREGFDAQLWPVLVALCVLCGVSAGTILTFLRGPLLWASLLMLPISAALAAYVLGLIENRYLRRSLQFGILISLAVHLLLLTGAFHTDIFGRSEVATRERPRTIQRRTIRRPVDFPTDAWTETNPVDLPDPDRTPTEVQREVETSPERPQPIPVEQPRQVTDPNLERRPESDRTPPRQQETLSQLSRQSARDLPQSSTRADVARTADVAESTSASASAETRVSAEAMAAAAPARATAEAPTAQSAATPTRRQTDGNPNSEAVELARTRADRPDPATSGGAASADAPTVAASDAASTSAAADTPAIARTDPSSAATGRTATVEPDPVRTPQPAVERRSAAESEPQPTLARNSRSSVDTPRTTSRPDTADRVETAVASQAPRPDLEATAAAGGAASAAAESSRSRVARTSPEAATAASSETSGRRAAATEAATAPALASSAAARRQASSEVPITTAAASTAEPSSTTVAPTLAAAPGESSVRQRTTEEQRPTQNRPSETPTTSSLAQRPRATRSDASAADASILPNAPAADAPRRALASSVETASPTTVESPALAAAGQGPISPAAEARALATSRAEEGIAGRGRSPNLEADSPASERPALQASNSARRERSTRAEETGDALASSLEVSRARARAEAAAPSSTVSADTTANSTLSGAEQVEAAVASAGAAVTSAAAPINAVDVAAMQGSAEIDIGAMKVVSEAGIGRGSGGGSPETSSDPTPLADGSASRTGRTAAVAASTQADVPSAPLADGGGEPATLEAQGLASIADADGGATDATRSPTAGDRGERTEFEGAGPIPADAVAAMSRRSTDGDDGSEGAATLAALAGRERTAAGPTIDTSADAPEASPGTDESDEDEEERARRLAEAGAPGAATDERTTGSERVGSSPGDPPADADAIGGLAEMSGPSRRGRSESATAAPGALALGGGDRRPTSGTLPASDTAADVTIGSTTTPGAEGDGASPDVGRLAAAGPDRADAMSPAGGGRGERATEVGGDPIAGGSENALPTRRSRGGAVEGNGALPRESLGRSGADLGGPAATNVDLGQLAGGAPAGEGTTPGGAASDGTEGDAVATSRAVTGGVRVDVMADEGPGGLGTEFASEAGINDRRARIDDGPLANIVDSRFRRRESGGEPTMNTAAAVATEAYRDRERGRAGQDGGPQTEEAIENGLAFLIRHQETEGHWRLERFGNGLGDATDERSMTRSDTAATGLALLAFQGAGYNHLEYRYADPMRRAIDWMVARQKPDGDLYVESDPGSSGYARLYSHAIAALALCEAYGVTQDPTLKEPAQKALDFIVASQDKQLGGWRYTPGRGADTSVSGWMMMALKSGRLAGLKVENEPFERIEKWMLQAVDADRPGHFRYNPFAENTERQAHGREVTASMTAVGLLMRLYSGDDRDDPAIRSGAALLLANLPSDLDSRTRDTYYWYYATQVMRHVDGETWKTWAGALRPLLLDSQVTQGEYAGSWDPLLPVPDRWSLHGGRLYLTTMNLLSLEVDYRLLPLYDDTVK